MDNGTVTEKARVVADLIMKPPMALRRRLLLGSGAVAGVALLTGAIFVALRKGADVVGIAEKAVEAGTAVVAFAAS